MIRFMTMTVFTAAMTVLLWAGVPASAQDRGEGKHVSESPACNLKLIEALYGFQCHGSVSTGGPLEPVTFLGIVEGDAKGVFTGEGTFNSSLGSQSARFSGPATMNNRCLGRVNYTSYEVKLPNGTWIPLPPVSFDFAAVDEGKEILGTGVVTDPTFTGDFVPRLTCRLVRIR